MIFYCEREKEKVNREECEYCEFVVTAKPKRKMAILTLDYTTSIQTL